MDTTAFKELYLNEVQRTVKQITVVEIRAVVVSYKGQGVIRG